MADKFIDSRTNTYSNVVVESVINHFSCGDGVAMYRTEGFTVEGNKAVSPYFEMFEIQGDPLMTFRCNVTLCSVGCNGVREPF